MDRYMDKQDIRILRLNNRIQRVEGRLNKMIMELDSHLDHGKEEVSE